MPKVQFDVTDEQHEKLQKIAEEKPTIMKYVYSEMVSDYIKKHEAKK